MTTTTAASQTIQISPQVTLTLTTPTTHYSPSTGAALTGTWIWPASLLLSHYISSHLSLCLLLDATVLELGAGFGLPGMTAARLGARHVTLTDIAIILPVPSQNVIENGLEDVAEVRELVWGKEVFDDGRNYDVVLMSDVFYDVGMMEGLGRTLRSVCDCGGGRRKVVVVLGVSEAREWNRECLRELEKEGFEVKEMEVFGCCDEVWGGLQVDGSFVVYEFVRREGEEIGSHLHTSEEAFRTF